MTEPGYVLIVDDDEDVRDMLVFVLKARGYRVLSASDGLEALDYLGNGRLPSLILLDLRMPRLNGEELIAWMRARPQLANIPYVILSGDNAADAIARSLDARACFSKPIELHELLSVVARFAAAARL